MGKDRWKIIPAVYLILQQDDKVLLLRRFNTGWQDGNYSLIAGHLDGGEPVTVAMAREAREEAGITIYPGDLRVVHVMHRKSDDERVDFFLTTDKWTGEIENREPQKCDDLSWYSLSSLPENIIPNVRVALNACANGQYFSEFGW